MERNMSSKIFGFYLESGLLLKNLSDILLLCSEKICTMEVSEASIDFSKIDKSFAENECKVLIRLDTSHLTSFFLQSTMVVTLHVKYFNKLCKTLKKKDKVTLWIDTDSSLHIETREDVMGISKIVEKEMNVTVLFDSKVQEIPNIDSYFSNVAFTISPTLIQEIRKSIGTKAAPMEVKISEKDYLEFNSTWSGAGPLKITLGKPTADYNTIIISAGVVHILSKLSQLCNKLKFYQQKEHSSINILKISGKLDTPCYLGEVCILIKEISKKT